MLIGLNSVCWWVRGGHPTFTPTALSPGGIQGIKIMPQIQQTPVQQRNNPLASAAALYYNRIDSGVFPCVDNLLIIHCSTVNHLDVNRPRSRSDLTC